MQFNWYLDFRRRPKKNVSTVRALSDLSYVTLVFMTVENVLSYSRKLLLFMTLLFYTTEKNIRLDFSCAHISVLTVVWGQTDRSVLGLWLAES